MTKSTNTLPRDSGNVVSDVQELLTGGARAAAKTADGYVHDNPWPLIGASAAIGLAVGLVLARR